MPRMSRAPGLEQDVWFELGGVVEDAKRIVKNNPLAALLGAAALGFLLAKAFSRD